MWFAMPTSDGIYYRNGSGSGDLGRHASALLRSIARGDTKLGPEQKINHGAMATVYRVGSFAIKSFNRKGWSEYSRRPSVSGLPYLQASVAINEGLRLTQQEPTYDKSTRRQYVYSAPEVYACYVPKKYDPLNPGLCAMAYENGSNAGAAGVDRPSIRSSLSAYHRALAAVGLRRCAVIFDEATCWNTLSRPSQKWPDVTELIRLDVTALHDYYVDPS